MIFDATTARFQLVFNVNTGIRQPTIVYINEELNYPQGFDIQVTPANSLTWNSTSPNYYQFFSSVSVNNGTSITINITQKKLIWILRAWNWMKQTFPYWLNY